MRWPRDAWALPALEKAGVLTRELAEAIRAEAPEWVAQVVVERGIASAERALSVLAQAAHVPPASLEGIEPAAVHVLPEAVARQHAALALSVTSKSIRIATSNPLDFDAERALGFATSRAVEFLYALPADLALRMDEVYRPERSIERLVSGLAGGAQLEPAAEVPAAEATPVEAPAARLVDATIADAVRERASEVQLEPFEGGLIVCYVVDGVVREVMRVPKSSAGNVTRRVKVLAKLDLAERLRAAEGRATARVEGKLWELRVAASPAGRLGERVVITLTDPAAPPLKLEELGLWPDERMAIEALLTSRDGLVLVSGPEGSGRSITVTAARERLRAAGANLVTLEIRFGETAAAACESASAGKFVLASIDSDDAPSSIARLREAGVEAAKVAATLRGAVAQRLLRRLCPRCSEPAGPDSLPAPWRPRSSWIERPIAVKRARGCAHCGFTGYRGRDAIAQVLTVDAPVAELLAGDAPRERLLESGRRFSMRSLWEAALRRVWAGETSFEEAQRVVGEPHGVAVEPAAPVAAPAQRQIPLVLIADDDPAMRDLETAVLQAAGLAVAESADGAEALDLARMLHPSIMLLDMDMPVLDGFAVLEELRTTLSGRGVPVIVVTSYDDPETERHCIELGAEDYITKPIQPSTLVARIRAVLRRVDGGGTGSAWPKY